MGCDPNEGFNEEILIQAQMGSIMDIFLECEGNNKDDLYSFQAQTIRIDKFILIQCNGLK